MPTPAPAAPKAGAAGFIQKKIGPLPMWGWVVIGAAGVGIVLYMRKRAGSSGTAADVTAIPTGDLAGGGGGGGLPTEAPAPGPNAGGPGGGAPTGAGGSTPTGGGGVIDVPTVPSSQAAMISTGTAPAGASTPYTRGSLQAASNALASTISGAVNTLSRGGDRLVAFQTGFNATNAQVASALTARGYTAGSYGGQVYAARTPQTFFAQLPTEARNNLARLLVAQSQQRAA